MRWYRSFVEEEDSVFMGDLISRFGLKGYFFWKKLKALMAEHFDVLNPACNEFNRQWFELQFSVGIKDQRTIKKYLDFLQDQEKIFYVFKSPMIILYYPELEGLCDRYTLEGLAKMAIEDKIEIGNKAQNLHTFCKNHASTIRINHHENADRSLEDKEVKSFSLASNRPVELASPSNSKRRQQNAIGKDTSLKKTEEEVKILKRPKKKSKKKESFKDLAEAELVAMFEKSGDLEIKTELENRGFRVASFGTN